MRPFDMVAFDRVVSEYKCGVFVNADVWVVI